MRKAKNISLIIEKTAITTKTDERNPFDSKVRFKFRTKTSLTFKARKVRKTNKTFGLLECLHSFIKSGTSPTL